MISLRDCLVETFFKTQFKDCFITASREGGSQGKVMEPRGLTLRRSDKTLTKGVMNYFVRRLTWGDIGTGTNIVWFEGNQIGMGRGMLASSCSMSFSPDQRVGFCLHFRCIFCREKWEEVLAGDLEKLLWGFQVITKLLSPLCFFHFKDFSGKVSTYFLCFESRESSDLTDTPGNLTIMLARCWEGWPTLGALLEKNISFFLKFFF